MSRAIFARESLSCAESQGGFSTARSRATSKLHNLQCAGTASSVARPAGGTTTVDKLPSTVSF